MKFEQEIRSSLAGKPPEPLVWVYCTFVTKGPGGSWSSPGGGEFMGAAVVEAPSRFKVVDVVFDRELIPKGTKVGMSIDVPADKLPSEQFRNRLLSRQEVEEMWPGVKVG